MKVAVARAGAAAVGARGAECGGGRPGACSRGRSPRRERWQHALDFSALQANWGWTAGEQENGLPSPRDMNHQLWITQLAEVGSARPQSHTLPARHRLVLRSARLHPALTSCDPVSLHRTVGARVCSLLEENSVKLSWGALWHGEQRAGRAASKWKLENETRNHSLETPSAEVPFPQGESLREKEAEDGEKRLRTKQCSERTGQQKEPSFGAALLLAEPQLRLQPEEPWR
ncbi:uncharacterized protein LOC107497017 isoform X1 [Rousettus aegyptiacus]|uniref:uncharacterized protein LOC107497017 isoform X1 n=1 Tax=Rousettus aegyptiacus TaxID=9407 RepID=UPI00168D7747|nr:uncharacterized protein LOC107497017 isoform X1 [Rousettus aegyptiacus]